MIPQFQGGGNNAWGAWLSPFALRKWRVGGLHFPQRRYFRGAKGDNLGAVKKHNRRGVFLGQRRGRV